MIHLKYKFKVNFVKLPLIWIDLCLKLASKIPPTAATQAAARLWTARVARSNTNPLHFPAFLPSVEITETALSVAG